MNEQLAQEIAQLEEQARIFSKDMENATDDTKAALQAEIDTVNAKIAQRKQQIEAVSTAIQTTQEALSDAFNTIEFGGQYFSLRDFARDEESAQALNIWFKMQAGQIAEQYSAQTESYKAEIEELHSELQEKDARISIITADNERLGLSNSDLQAKRDAAATVIEDHEATIKRLTEDNKQLREAAAPKPKGPTTTAEFAESLQKMALARPAIYNVERVANNKNNAILAETGEAIVITDIGLTKYRIIDEQEASQFRQEAEQAQTNPVPDLPLVHESSIEPPALPSEAASNGLDVADTDTGAPLAAETLSVEERLARLEKAVFNQ